GQDAIHSSLYIGQALYLSLDRALRLSLQASAKTQKMVDGMELRHPLPVQVYIVFQRRQTRNELKGLVQAFISLFQGLTYSFVRPLRKQAALNFHKLMCDGFQGTL